MSKYVIITPAHNEEEFIEKTAESMVSQTLRPVKWIVVDDGSTDKTFEVVSKWAGRFDFIQVLCLKREQERNFARKALAFEEGFRHAQALDFDFIGNVDADMSFGPQYFLNILQEFESDPKLGISGGIVYTKFTHTFVTYDTTPDSVGGKVQLFRRGCFNSVGGYKPLKHGGIDTAAEIMARMQGWTVRKSFSEPAFEHRRTSFSWGKPVMAKMREGRHFYYLGYDPLFYVLRCIYRLKEYPFIIGSLAALTGYIKGMLCRDAFVLPHDVVAYLRAEQRSKMRRMFQLRHGKSNLRVVPPRGASSLN